MAAIVKTVKRYGNSGGIYVPNNWIGGRVRAELIEEPFDVKKDLISKIPLEHVISVILYGSYARNEQSDGSDIDIIIVVDEDAKLGIPSGLNKMYDIQVKSMDDMRNAVMHDAVLHKILKDEAVALINRGLLQDLLKEKPDLGSIEARISLAESALNIVKVMIKEGAERAEMVYPLMLRLKEMILVHYLIENRKYSTGMVKKEAIAHGISQRDFSLLMDTYRAVRGKKETPEYTPSEDTIDKLILIIEEKIRHVREKKGKKRHRIS